MKKNILKISGFIFLFVTLTLNLIVYAANNDANLNVGDLNLQSIRIPLFLPFDPKFGSSLTVFSWITYIGIIATGAIIVFWIYLIIRTAVKAMQSHGEADALADVSKRFRSIFIGMFITFLFPIVLSVIGVLLGVGTIFAWPKMFSRCDNHSGSTGYEYYFQAYLELGGDDADVRCGYTT